MNKEGFRFYPVAVNLMIVVLIVGSLTTPNAIISAIALLILILLPKLTWQHGHPPVILICLIFQWLQASTKILQANLASLSVNDFTGSGDAFNSILLSQIAIIVLAIGTNLITRQTKNVSINQPVNWTEFNIDKIFRLYVLFFVGCGLLSTVIFIIPGLTQILLSFTFLKWVLYSLLFLTILTKKTKYHYLIIIFLVELGYNSLGYYSTFKEVFFVTFILVGAFIKQIKVPALIIGGVTIFLLFNLAVIWTGIKGDYRHYLVSSKDVTFSEKVDYISDLYTNFYDFDAATDATLERIAYTNMLMFCIENIPAAVPFEGGKVWKEAVEHVLMPRIFFPGKRILNDSEKANAYTGRQWTGVEQGTSISIGYVAESYVDFGKLGMFMPIFILGLLVGFIYKKLLSYNYHPFILFSLVIPAVYFTKFNLIENSNDKLLGALLMNFLIFTLFIRYGLKYVINYIKS